MMRDAIKFGVFVLVCLVFTVYLAFTIGNIEVSDPLGRGTYQLTATFDDVTGLLRDDNVKIAGVVVGKVTGVTTQDGRAVVSFEVDDDRDDIPSDSIARIRWRNLIGQRYLYLEPGDSPEALADGDEIDLEHTDSVVDLGELFDRLGPIVASIDPAQVNDFLETITQALDGREDKVGAALDDLATLTKGLASRDEAIERLISNVDVVADTINARDAQIEQMLQNLVTLSESFGDNSATLEAALVELGDFGTNLGSFLDSSSDEIDRLLGNLALVTGTVHDRLPELDTALANLADASAAIFRAGNRGEFLNQKILCAFIGPPDASEDGCPAPIVGVTVSSEGAVPYAAPSSGAAAIQSLLERVVGR